jgi:hypothetical protein
MPNVISRIFFALTIIGLSLSLSGCGYNNRDFGAKQKQMLILLQSSSAKRSLRVHL